MNIGIQGHRCFQSLTPEEALETAITGAKANLAKYGNVLPALMVVTENFFDVFTLPMKDEAEKIALEALIPKIIRDTNAKAALMINEAWTKDPKTLERTGEILVVVISTPERTEGKAFPILRDQNEKPSLGDEEILSGVFCRWLADAWTRGTAH